MKKMHTGLMSAAALLLSAAALAAPQGTSGSSGGSMGGSSSGGASQSAGQGPAGGSSSMRGSSGSGSEQLASADRRFIMEAASAGMFEVQAAELAQTKAQDASAKSFAKLMITDHEKNNRQLMQIAQSKGITPPAKLDSKHQAMLTKLQKAGGADFDEQYGKIMHDSHMETVRLFERGQQQVQDTELKSYISQTLPTLQRHHEQAMSLPGGKGSSTRQAEASRPGSGSGSSSGMDGSGSSSSGMGGSSSNSGMGSSGSGSTPGSMGGGTGSTPGSMGGGTGSTSGSMGGTSGSSSSSGTTTRPPGSSSTGSTTSSDTGSTGRP